MASLHIDDATTVTGAFVSTPTYVTDGSAITDDDLSTYIELTTEDPSRTDMVKATFAPPPASATTVTLTLIASRQTSNTARLVWDIFDQSSIDVGSVIHLDDYPVDTPITYTRTFDDAYFAPGGQGETEDFVNPSGLTYADFLTALRTNTPPYLRFFTNAIGIGALTTRLYTATLTYPGGPTSRRKYPNATGQGVGPTRHWPKPRRGVTGIN